MEQNLSREDVAVMIRARQISRQVGLPPDADIKTICEQAGISRKTGYQWAEEAVIDSENTIRQLKEENERLKAENKKLGKELSDVKFENEGRRISWELHKVDELLAGKKNNSIRIKRKKQ